MPAADAAAASDDAWPRWLRAGAVGGPSLLSFSSMHPQLKQANELARHYSGGGELAQNRIGRKQ